MKNFIETFDQQFLKLHERSREFIERVPNEKLYWQPRAKDALFPVNSCGEYILRSAAAIEQTFGGIMTRLWDDPFEWTLPEALSTGDLILNYLDETEETRRKGFGFFASDEDLRREIPAPERLRSIFQILLDTLARAEHFQGRAFAVFRTFSDEKLPRLA
ncbi:MAG TPA: hypothetical protein VIL74_13345 [Pyrinomonadaceae bacterium]|jgi:hypothetical protein